MEASILIWGTITFLAALAVHIALWRLSRPPREMAWLVVLFMVLPLVLYFLFFLVFKETGDSISRLAWGWRLALTFIWHAALSSAYIMTYPPIQAGCPSLKIVLAVRRAGKQGLSSDEIIGLFSEETMFSDRFNDLIEDGLVSWKYDTWGISGGGRLIARFFIFYRKLLKLPLGEG